MQENFETKTIETENLVLRKGTKEEYKKIYGEALNGWWDGDDQNFYSSNEEVCSYDWLIFDKENNLLGNILTQEDNKNHFDHSILYRLTQDFDEDVRDNNANSRDYLNEALDSVMNYLFERGAVVIRYKNSSGELEEKKFQGIAR